MPTNVNAVVVSGNLTRDAKLSYATNGNAYCFFDIAINRRELGADGQVYKQTDYVNVQVWGKIAEENAPVLLKGVYVMVWGKLRNTSYMAKSGAKVNKLLVIAEQIITGGPISRSANPSEVFGDQIGDSEEEPFG